MKYRNNNKIKNQYQISSGKKRGNVFVIPNEKDGKKYKYKMYAGTPITNIYVKCYDPNCNARGVVNKKKGSLFVLKVPHNLEYNLHSYANELDNNNNNKNINNINNNNNYYINNNIINNDNIFNIEKNIK